MAKYMAFLRGINVGGHKIIKMKDLSNAFASLGFKNVKTFIQSGNVIFEDDKNANDSTKKIESKLLKLAGYEVAVFLRTISDIEDMVRHNPFKETKFNDAKKYVTFLYDKPKSKPKLPLMSSKKDVEVIGISNRELFCLAFQKNGRFGFPNAFVEKEFGMKATTRNWNTVSKILKIAD